MTLFKLVGFLVPSHTHKTFKIMYNLEELQELINRLQSNPTHVLLGLVQRNELHNSIHSFPMFKVEISQFVNAYSLDRKNPTEILNSITEKDIENQ
jgi:hypothetical protein